MRAAARLMQRLMPLLLLAGLGCGLAMTTEPAHGIPAGATVAAAAARDVATIGATPATPAAHSGADRALTRTADCAEDLADVAATATRVPDVGGQAAVLVSLAAPSSSPARWSGRSRPELPPAVGLRHVELSVLRI